MGIFLAKLGELVPRALPTHVSKIIEANPARAPNSLCVAWRLPEQYLLSLRKRASMELISRAILSWLLFGRKFVLLIREEPRGRGCIGQCYHGGRQPAGKRQHIGRPGIRRVCNPPIPKYIRIGSKKQLRFSQPVLAGSVVALSPRCGRGLRRSHTSVSSIW